jgi:BMFP domain-containing protein YqiC
MRMTFDEFVEILVAQRDRRKYLEERVKELEKQLEDVRLEYVPGWKELRQRERGIELDTEIRLLREQG